MHDAFYALLHSIQKKIFFYACAVDNFLFSNATKIFSRIFLICRRCIERCRAQDGCELQSESYVSAAALRAASFFCTAVYHKTHFKNQTPTSRFALAGPPRDPPEVGAPLRPVFGFYAINPSLTWVAYKNQTPAGWRELGLSFWKNHSFVTLTAPV